MDDFIDMQEAQMFHVLGPIPATIPMPFYIAEAWAHGVALMEIGAASSDYGELQERFQRTFREEAEADRGGDVLFKFWEGDK